VVDIQSGAIVEKVAGPKPGAPFGNRAYIIAVSPDESAVAAVSGSPTGTSIEPVRLYSAPGMNPTAVLVESAAAPWIGVSCLGFSRDSKLLAVGRTDGSVAVFDVSAKKLVMAIDAFRKYQQPVMSVAVSPDDQFVAVGGTMGQGQWRNPDGSPAPGPNQGQLSAPDGINIYRTSDGALVAEDTDRMGWVLSMAWRAPDNLIAFVTFDQTLQVWNPWRADNGSKTFQIGYGTDSVAISPDGSRIAAGGGGKLLLYRFDDRNDEGGKE